MMRALERAGNRLKGRAGVTRDTLRGVHPTMAAATLGETLVADAGFSTFELIGDDAFDGVTSSFKVWATDAADQAHGIVGSFLGIHTVASDTLLEAAQADHIGEAAIFLRNEMGNLASVRLFDPQLIQSGELIPQGFVRNVLARAGGQGDVVTSNAAYVALTPQGNAVPGLATGPDIDGYLRGNGGTIEAYRWVYGPSQRQQPFPPHVRLNGKAFRTFDDPVLANGSGFPPFAFYMPGDHAGCRCDYEPIMLTPEQAKALGITPGRPPSDGPEDEPAIDDLVEQILAEQEPPAVRIRPATGTADPLALVDFATPKAQTKFGPTFDALAELHGVKMDGMPTTIVRVGGKAKYKGGHFSPGNRGPKPKRLRGKPMEQYVAEMRAWRDSPLVPEIVISDRGDGTELFSLLHEFGHRIDFVPGPAGREAFGYLRNERRLGDAVNAFQTAAKASTPIVDAYKNWQDFGFVEYFRSPHEVWARAYSQWAARELGGPWQEAFEASQRAHATYQWPTEEFDRDIAPLVEGVLREWGMIE